MRPGHFAERRLHRAALLLLGAFAVGDALAAPRIEPVPDASRDAQQQAIAARFASSGMTNAVATYLAHPALAEAVLPYAQYVSNDSTLPARHRALLLLRTAWLTRSGYLWAHQARRALRNGLYARGARAHRTRPHGRRLERLRRDIAARGRRAARRLIRQRRDVGRHDARVRHEPAHRPRLWRRRPYDARGRAEHARRRDRGRRRGTLAVRHSLHGNRRVDESAAARQGAANCAAPAARVDAGSARAARPEGHGSQRECICDVRPQSAGRRASQCRAGSHPRRLDFVAAASRAIPDADRRAVPLRVRMGRAHARRQRYGHDRCGRRAHCARTGRAGRRRARDGAAARHGRALSRRSDRG